MILSLNQLYSNRNVLSHKVKVLYYYLLLIFYFVKLRGGARFYLLSREWLRLRLVTEFPSNNDQYLHKSKKRRRVQLLYVSAVEIGGLRVQKKDGPGDRLGLNASVHENAHISRTM